MFARSKNRGATWSEPVAVTPPGEPIRPQPESSPVMVCDDDGHVGIAWSTTVEGESTGVTSSNVRFARSQDGGRSWEDPVTVNDDAASGPGMHAYQGLAMYNDGSLLAAWLDSRPGGERLDADESEGMDASVHVARSLDFGGHWGPNAPEWSRACGSCRVAVAVDVMNRPLLAFRRHYPGQVRDAVVARLDAPAVRARGDDWVVSSPGTGPAIAFARDGTLRLAWFSGVPGHVGVWFREDVPEYDSTATPLAVLHGDDLPIVHVGLGEAGMSGTLIACDADSSGDRVLVLARVHPSGRRVEERIRVPGTEGASHPCVAALNTCPYALVAWTTMDAGRNQVKLLRWDAGR